VSCRLQAAQCEPDPPTNLLLSIAKRMQIGLAIMAMQSTRKGFLMTLMIESPRQKTGTHILPPSSTSHTSTCATKRTTPLVQEKKDPKTHNPLSCPQLTPPLPKTKTQSLKTKEHPPTHNFLLLIHSKQQQPNKNRSRHSQIPLLLHYSNNNNNRR
jgi:hypothetical protein